MLEKLKRRIATDGRKSALKYANRVAYRVADSEKKEFDEIHLNLIYAVHNRYDSRPGMVYAMREELQDLQYEERNSL